MTQKRYTDRQIAELGCLVCLKEMGIFTPSTIHHIRKLATSKKRCKSPRIPLCARHHLPGGGYGVAIHDGEEEWERLHGSVLEMVKTTKKMLEAKYGDHKRID